MKETMKAEAAELLAEMRKRSVTGTGITLSSGSNGLLVEAFDAMQAEIEAHKWISVKDRLPNDQQKILFAEKWSDEIYSGYFKSDEFIVSSFGLVVETGNMETDLVQNEITHWQPLPEPPKQHSKTLWAVNIPEEPDSEELLFAATSKKHAQSIVSRLHNEIFETYPTFGEPIADSIYVTEWQGSSEEHAESLATKWWEHTSFVECE